ncbi:MAG: hypothetical protein AAB110_06555 [Candidatus Desantisbacteria bacterium]
MKQHNKYALIGLQALQRAVTKVAEDAQKNNYKIPIWENGRIKYEIPTIIIAEQSIQPDAEIGLK